MTPYEEWAQRHPHAAGELACILTPATATDAGESEARAQQRARLTIAQQGAYAFRNNVGATPSRCPDCNAPQRVVRYGLANDSQRLNERIKSSDLILAIPRVITTAMAGTTIAQFGAVEVKRPGWTFTGKGREAGQQAWLALVAKAGGFATFSTGEVTL